MKIRQKSESTKNAKRPPPCSEKDKAAIG
jgi:hypothetical protein